MRCPCATWAGASAAGGVASWANTSGIAGAAPMTSPKPSAVAPIVVNNPRGVMLPPLARVGRFSGAVAMRPRLGERSARLRISRSLALQSREETWENSGKRPRSYWENRRSARAVDTAPCGQGDAAYFPALVWSAVTWIGLELERTGVARGIRT